MIIRKRWNRTTSIMLKSSKISLLASSLLLSETSTPSPQECQASLSFWSFTDRGPKIHQHSTPTSSINTWCECPTLKSSTSSPSTAQVTASLKEERKPWGRSHCSFSNKSCKHSAIKATLQCLDTLKEERPSSTLSMSRQDSHNFWWWIDQFAEIYNGSKNSLFRHSWSTISKTMAIPYGRASCYTNSFSRQNSTHIEDLFILFGCQTTSGKRCLTSSPSSIKERVKCTWVLKEKGEIDQLLIKK